MGADQSLCQAALGETNIHTHIPAIQWRSWLFTAASCSPLISPLSWLPSQDDLPAKFNAATKHILPQHRNVTQLIQQHAQLTLTPDSVLSQLSSQLGGELYERVVRAFHDRARTAALTLLTQPTSPASLLSAIDEILVSYDDGDGDESGVGVGGSAGELSGVRQQWLEQIRDGIEQINDIDIHQHMSQAQVETVLSHVPTLYLPAVVSQLSKVVADHGDDAEADPSADASGSTADMDMDTDTSPPARLPPVGHPHTANRMSERQRGGEKGARSGGMVGGGLDLSITGTSLKRT